MSLPFMRLPLLAFLLLGSLLPVLASLSVAGGEPDAVTRGYNYFSQFCMEKFPDIGEIERAMDQAGWKRIFATPNFQCNQTASTENWMSDDVNSRTVFGL